jgi:hypothetical protein
MTDYRCLDHAPFLKPASFPKKCEQRNAQPENSDRLSVLVDEKTGIFTSCTEFTELCEGLIIKDTVSQEASIGDILKVHDFNYIFKVIQHIKKLEGTRNKII